MKVIFYVVRQELDPTEASPTDRIFLKAVKDGQPTGPEMPMFMDEWEDMNPLQVGGKDSPIFEYELTPEQEKEQMEIQERFNWLMEPKRVVFLVQIANKKIDVFDVKNMFRFADIQREYQNKFNESPVQFIRDVQELPKKLQSMFSEE